MHPPLCALSPGAADGAVRCLLPTGAVRGCTERTGGASLCTCDGMLTLALACAAPDRRESDDGAAALAILRLGVRKLLVASTAFESLEGLDAASERLPMASEGVRTAVDGISRRNDTAGADLDVDACALAPCTSVGRVGTSGGARVSTEPRNVANGVESSTIAALVTESKTNGRVLCASRSWNARSSTTRVSTLPWNAMLPLHRR